MSAGGRSLRVSGSHPNEVWDKMLSAHCSALIALATDGRAAGALAAHGGPRFPPVRPQLWRADD